MYVINIISASEAMALRRYTNLIIIIIIMNMLDFDVLESYWTNFKHVHHDYGTNDVD